jgi:hypothetical protein
VISDDDIDERAPSEAGPALDPGEPTSSTQAASVASAPVAVAVAPDRRRPSLLVPAVLLTLLVAAMALALVQSSKAADAADERDRLADAASDRQAATLVAAQFAEAFFTYDFEDVDASTANVLTLVTDEYAEDFQSENVPGLQDLFGDVALVSAGVADEVVIGEIDGDTARGLARVDIDTTVQGVDRTLADLTLSIVLRRQAGEWRVDEVRIVQAHPEGDDLTTGTTGTTGTTAPAG